MYRHGARYVLAQVIRANSISAMELISRAIYPGPGYGPSGPLKRERAWSREYSLGNAVALIWEGS